MAILSSFKRIGRMGNVENWIFAAILLLLLIQAVFGVYQWRQIDGQNVRLEAIIEKLRLEQRAWLSAAQTVTEDFTPGNKARASIIFKNTGHTPANIVLSTVTIMDMQANNDVKSIQDNDRESAEAMATINTVPPGGAFATTGGYSPDLTEALIAQIESGERKLIVFATCYYRDVIENKLRTSQCCYYWSPQSNTLYPHNQGNYMD